MDNPAPLMHVDWLRWFEALKKRIDQGVIIFAEEIVGGQALTRVNDTNVTATLTGTPATALLKAVTITLGWTGTLGLARGGTAADLSATGGTAQYLKQSSVGAAITVGTIPASDIASPGALTRTNDTNVTVTLGGSPTVALLAATSLTLGWTGTLGVARGGTNIASYAIGDLLYASGATTLSKLADVAAGSYLRSGGVTTAPVWSTLTLPNAATAGDLLYASAANTLIVRAIGSAADVLTVSGGLPVWAAPAAAATSVIVNDVTTNATMFPVWVTANTGSLPLKVSSTKLSFNPSTGILATSGVSVLNNATTTGSLETIDQTRNNTNGNVAVKLLGLTCSRTAGTANNGANLLDIAYTGEAVGLGRSIQVTHSAGSDVGMQIDMTTANSSAGLYVKRTNTLTSPMTVEVSNADLTTRNVGLRLSRTGGTIANNTQCNLFDATAQSSTGTSRGMMAIDGYVIDSTDASYSGGLMLLTTDSLTLAVRARLDNKGRFGLGVTPTAILHLKAGTAAANTAPFKFTTGTSLTTAEAGALEFTTDDYFATITTGAARKGLVLNDGANLTSGLVPVATTNGRLIDGPTLTTLVIVRGTGRATAQVAAVASVATFTLTAADASFIVDANVNVTTSTLHNFTVAVDYTDETNAAQTLTLSFSQLSGVFVTAITQVTGAGPYEGIPLHIRCKASTAITMKTVGTFTTVVYNVEGNIKQVA